MGKSLIITEKPSVAQEFAKVLRVSGRNDGYIENGEYVISWCVGHLVGLVYPESYDMKYKKWRLEDLPFLPEACIKYISRLGGEARDLPFGLSCGKQLREDFL